MSEALCNRKFSCGVMLIPILLLSRYKVELEEGFDNILVVDGVPVIDKSKLEKLLTKVCKEFSKKGAHIKPDDIFVPWDDSTGKSKGYLIFTDL